MFSILSNTNFSTVILQYGITFSIYLRPRLKSLYKLSTISLIIITAFFIGKGIF